MRARKKDWGGAVNSAILLAETEYKKNKENKKGEDDLDLEA